MKKTLWKQKQVTQFSLQHFASKSRPSQTTAVVHKPVSILLRAPAGHLEMTTGGYLAITNIGCFWKTDGGHHVTTAGGYLLWAVQMESLHDFFWTKKATNHNDRGCQKVAPEHVVGHDAHVRRASQSYRQDSRKLIPNLVSGGTHCAKSMCFSISTQGSFDW